MFSYDDLVDRVRCGALVDYSRWIEQQQLLDPDERPVRELYLVPAAMTEWDNWTENAVSVMHAELIGFVIGRQLWWGDLANGNHMKPLDPQTGWIEFKNRGAPQTRLFGAFVLQDTFIGVCSLLRSAVPRDIERNLETIWHDTWPSVPPRLRADDPSELVTNYRLDR